MIKLTQIAGIGSRALLLFLLVTASCFATPKIQNWTTAKGVNVYFVETHDLPMLDVRVVFDAGSARDGKKYGLAALTATLLDRGAGNWDATTISQRLEGVGAQLGVGASTDSAALSFRSLSESDILDSVIETASTILAKPRFTKLDFLREKKRALAGLKYAQEQPGTIARELFYANMYGDHPYAHPSNGTFDSVTNISRKDLVKFYRRYYVANNGMVILVGDISKTQAETIANKLMSGLKKGKVPAPLPAVSIPQKENLIRHQFPSQQTHVLSGMPVVNRHDPDYFTLYVGNHILGGSGLVSKISNEVREKRGLAYSAYSYFSPNKRKGPFLMGLQTKNEQADDALKVLTQTLVDYRNHGPSEQELESAKKNITGGFVLRIDSNAKVAGYVEMIAFNGLKLDYLEQFNAKIEAVTVADIKKAFLTRINPQQLTTVLVGASTPAPSNSPTEQAAQSGE